MIKLSKTKQTWRQTLVEIAFAKRPELVDVLPPRLRQRVLWSLLRPRSEIELVRDLAFDAKHGTDMVGAKAQSSPDAREALLPHVRGITPRKLHWKLSYFQ